MLSKLAFLILKILGETDMLVMLYAIKIMEGSKKIEQVPVLLRSKVDAYLAELEIKID